MWVKPSPRLSSPLLDKQGSGQPNWTMWLLAVGLRPRSSPVCPTLTEMVRTGKPWPALWELCRVWGSLEYNSELVDVTGKAAFGSG